MKNKLKIILTVIFMLVLTLPQNKINTVMAKEELLLEEQESVEIAKLEIDNDSCYEGMDKTYSKGYVPEIKDGKAKIIVPIICKQGQIKNNEINVAINLGDPATMPFVNKNYSKTVKQKNLLPLNKKEKQKVYLVNASFDLKTDRVNGSYPVLITATGTDINGENIEKIFTIYVNISDGKSTDEEITTEVTEEVTEEAVTYAPKVLVDDVKISKSPILAGDEISVTVTLVNTSRTESIHNMSVTAAADGQYFSIQSASDSQYIGDIAAAGVANVELKYKINPSTPQGQYNLEISMDYADGKGATYNGMGNAKLNIIQEANVEFDKPVYVDEAKVGEIIDISVQAMNLGRSKVYNVRAIVECDGLEPAGTLFIGDMDPGTTANASTTANVISRRNSDEMYGVSEGSITFIYEDEQGQEFTQSEPITFNVKTPFTIQKEDTLKQDNPKQWWLVIACLVGVIAIIGTVSIVKRIIKRQSVKDDENDK